MFQWQTTQTESLINSLISGNIRGTYRWQSGAQSKASRAKRNVSSMRRMSRDNFLVYAERDNISALIRSEFASLFVCWKEKFETISRTCLPSWHKLNFLLNYSCSFMRQSFLQRKKIKKSLEIKLCEKLNQCAGIYLGGEKATARLLSCIITRIKTDLFSCERVRLP